MLRHVSEVVQSNRIRSNLLSSLPLEFILTRERFHDSLICEEN